MKQSKGGNQDCDMIAKLINRIDYDMLARNVKCLREAVRGEPKLLKVVLVDILNICRDLKNIMEFYNELISLLKPGSSESLYERCINDRDVEACEAITKIVNAVNNENDNPLIAVLNVLMREAAKNRYLKEQYEKLSSILESAINLQVKTSSLKEVVESCCKGGRRVEYLCNFLLQAEALQKLYAELESSRERVIRVG